MKFSVITPSFNHGQYIRDCLDSVRQQAGVSWEHIVIDGGSTDGTLAILRKYPHLQWVSEPDSGMSEAINKGFHRATGDWVMWLNTDDYLLPGALAKVAAFAERHPTVDVIYGQWQFVDASKRLLQTKQSLPYCRLMNIHSYTTIASTACFYRKETTVDAGFLIREELRYSMDVEYYARLGTAGKVFRHLPAVLAAFRIHGQNLSLKHIGQPAFPEILELQKQYAESAAIRRAYGITVSQHPYVNQFMDALLFFGFGGAKTILRPLYNSLGRRQICEKAHENPEDS
jgi:glycosyltransferase involved in cell wall biosynthesis